MWRGVHELKLNTKKNLTGQQTLYTKVCQGHLYGFCILKYKWHTQWYNIIWYKSKHNYEKLWKSIQEYAIRCKSMQDKVKVSKSSQNGYVYESTWNKQKYKKYIITINIYKSNSLRAECTNV